MLSTVQSLYRKKYTRASSGRIASIILYHYSTRFFRILRSESFHAAANALLRTWKDIILLIRSYIDIVVQYLFGFGARTQGVRCMTSLNVETSKRPCTIGNIRLLMQSYLMTRLYFFRYRLLHIWLLLLLDLEHFSRLLKRAYR